MRILGICLLVLSLFGCQQMQQQKRAEADQRLYSAMVKCRNGKDLTRKTAIERADCIGNAKRQRGYEINNPFMWILEQDIADDRESAVEYSEGKLTKDEYRTALQKHWADALETEAQALGQRRQENIQALQMLQGMQPAPAPTPQPYMIPTYSPPPVINTNCYGSGNSVNCTSYR
jgi:hypothetical protein